MEACGITSCGPNGTIDPVRCECVYTANCGDGVCTSPPENPANCAYDCTTPQAYNCGNGVCEWDKGEYAGICPSDCPCGDGVCDASKGESAANCAHDCLTPQPYQCGNGVCEAGEDDRCPLDCATSGGKGTPAPYGGTGTPASSGAVKSTPTISTCGDGTCGQDEDLTTCPEDCGLEVEGPQGINCSVGAATVAGLALVAGPVGVSIRRRRRAGH